MSYALDRDWSKTWTSAAWAVHGAVSYTDKKHLTLTDVMGFTGHAFRMNIDPEIMSIAAPTMFPGGYILRRNLCNLGFTSCLADPIAPVPPEKVEKVMALVQSSIDRGIPAISFSTCLYRNSGFFTVTTMTSSFFTAKTSARTAPFRIPSLLTRKSCCL